MVVRDFLLGDDLDLAIEGGDIAFGPSAEQHQRDILLAMKGAIRMAPTIGVGVRQMLLDNASADSLRRTIQQEMERDGMTIDHLSIAALGVVNLSASYD